MVLTDEAGNSTTKSTAPFEVIDFSNPEINLTSHFQNDFKKIEKYVHEKYFLLHSNMYLRTNF